MPGGKQCKLSCMLYMCVSSHCSARCLRNVYNILTIYQSMNICCLFNKCSSRNDIVLPIGRVLLYRLQQLLYQLCIAFFRSRVVKKMSAFQASVFFSLFTLVWLLNIPNLRGAKMYYVEPVNGNQGCNCSIISTKSAMCTTLNEYATIFSQTCTHSAPCTDESINMIFLPGIHELNKTLVIQEKESFEMGLYSRLANQSTDPCSSSCSHDHAKAEIQLQNASMEFRSIGNFTLDGINITVTSFDYTMGSIYLSDVPHHDVQVEYRGGLFLEITGAQLTHCTLTYVCHNCTGEASLSDVVFEGSSASFTITDSNDMTMAIQDVELALMGTQTGLAFYSLQLQSLSIDNVCMINLDRSWADADLLNHRTNPSYDMLFITDSMYQTEVFITGSSLERSNSTGLLINMTTQSPECQFSVTITDTNVSNHQYGGIVIEQTSKSVGKLYFNLINSRIDGNRIDVTENSCFAAGLSVHCETANTTYIHIENTKFVQNEDRRSQSIIVYISRVHHMTLENSDFIDNNGTAIQVNNVNNECVAERFIVKGTVNFLGNHGYRGGALSLISTVLSIKPNTALIFKDNKASDVGGAIFVDSNIPYDDEIDPDTLVSCFYKFSMWNGYSELYNITFINNTADNGGLDIYGTPLKCYCTVYTGEDGHVVRSIDQNVSDLFHFNEENHNSGISSSPSRVCLVDTEVDVSFKSACTNSSRIFDYKVKIYPGETFNLMVVIVGFEFGTGVGTVYAHVLNGDASISPEQLLQKIDKPANFSLSYTVNSTDAKVELALTTTNREVSMLHHDDHRKTIIDDDINRYNSSGVISTNLLTTPVFINIELEDKCPVGFEIRKHSNCDCKDELYGCFCDKRLENEQIRCSIKNGKGYFNISQQKQMWIGTDNNSNIRFYKNCRLDYCDACNYIISLENSTELEADEQCTQNRGGTLCGECRSDTSLAIGSNNCIKCDNNNLSLLVFFVPAGFFLVFFIKILNMTVSQGTINGLIFYANIVWAYKSIFFPYFQSCPTDNDSEQNVEKNLMEFLKVFLAWINLDFGIQACFAEGLNAIIKTWLQFLFPFYIWVIVGVIIILTKFSERMARLFGENKVSVLATIILLSYSKLLRTVMIILMPAYLVVLNGNETRQETVWAYDGNKKYWDGEHVSLFVFAILILSLILLPYTIILLCIQPLRSGSEYKCLKWVNHAYVKPFLDAYVGRLNPQNHFWVGLLLLVRCILFVIIAATYSSYPRVCELSLVLMMILLFLLLYYTRHIYSKSKKDKRYKCYHRKFLPIGVSFLTLLEISFFLNLLVLGVVRLYSDFDDTIEKDFITEAIIIYTSVGIVFIQFVGIVIYHLKRQFKKWKRIYSGYEDLNANPRVEAPPANNHGQVTITHVDPPSDNEGDNAYRDSILDETDSNESEEY